MRNIFLGYNCQEIYFYCNNNNWITKIWALDLVLSIYILFSWHCFHMLPEKLSEQFLMSLSTFQTHWKFQTHWVESISNQYSRVIRKYCSLDSSVSYQFRPLLGIMWVQWGISKGCNGGIFGGLSLGWCFGQIIEARTDNGDSDGMKLFFIVE